MSITINLNRERFNSLIFAMFLFWAGTFTLGASVLGLIVQPVDLTLALAINFAATGLIACGLILPFGLRQMAHERQEQKNRATRSTRVTPRKQRDVLVGNPGQGMLAMR